MIKLCLVFFISWVGFVHGTQKGICVYLIGISGSGKSTITQALKKELVARSDRAVIVLDADYIRSTLFPELGFSSDARSMNVKRMGYLASLIVQTRGICIVANCAPCLADRIYNRDLISKNGDYIEVFVNTPLTICVERDPKGLYKKWASKEIHDMLGLDIPFEGPVGEYLKIDGSESLAENIEKIITYMKELCDF